MRALGSAAASCALALGFLATSVASVPWNDFPVDPRTPGDAEPVQVSATGTAPIQGGPTSIAQVIAVLERAEQAANEAGRTMTPEIEQAAAELGTLLSIYMAQQRADVDPRPGAPTSAPPGAIESSSAIAVSDASAVSNVVAPADEEPAGGPTSASDDGDAPGTAAGQAAGAHAPEASDAAHADGEAVHEHEYDPVTFEDVVVAAMRLAMLLDPESAGYSSSIILADGTRTGTGIVPAGLTSSLIDVVERYANTTAGYANGRIPASVLCPLEFAPGHMLRCDAAQQLTKLSEAYEARFGVPIPLTDSYRSYASQVAVRIAKPHLAAVPGTSNHGWGLAVDLSSPISTGTSAEYVWMRLHAPDYGWDNPSWARPDGSKPEPWHFEFFAAGPIPDRALSAHDVGTFGTPPADKPDVKPAGKSGKPASGSKADAPKDDGKGSARPPAQRPDVEPPAEEPTDPPSEEPTDPPSEEPTDPPSEEPTDPPSEEPTDPPSEEPTDPPSECPEPGDDGATDGATDGAGSTASGEDGSEECPTEPEPTPSPSPSPSATPSPSPTSTEDDEPTDDPESGGA